MLTVSLIGLSEVPSPVGSAFRRGRWVHLMVCGDQLLQRTSDRPAQTAQTAGRATGAVSELQALRNAESLDDRPARAHFTARHLRAHLVHATTATTPTGLPHWAQPQPTDMPVDCPVLTRWARDCAYN